MIAIYKKELRILFSNMTGAVSIAAMLLTFGLMFRYYNLANGALTLHYTVSGSSLLFYIVIPVLTMRAFAEEQKQKTDQLYMTAPVTTRGIVWGKYLALVTVFALPFAVLCAFPLLMKTFGEETLLWDYSCIAAFFLMGCAYLAVGMFLSSCTESVIIAVIFTLIFVTGTQMLSDLYTLISADALTSVLFLLVLAVLAAIVVYAETRHFALSLLTFALLAGVLTAAALLAPGLFTGRTESLLRILDFSTHFSDFAGGVITAGNVVYFLTFAAAGIILTEQSLDRRRRS